MHTRQGGAAHVPILFFLMLLVLFLGALGFAYVTLTKNNDLETQIQSHIATAKVNKGRILLLEHYIEDIGNVFKVPGAYNGRERVSLEEYAEQKLDSVAGVMDPAALRQKIDLFARETEVSSTASLDSLFGAVNARIESLKQRVRDIEAERAKIAGEKSAVDAAFQQAGASHTQAQQTLRDQLTQTQQTFNAEKTNLSNLLDSTRQNLRDKNDELSAEKESRAAEKKGLLAEQSKLRSHNTALVSKINLINPPDVPDGKVIAARNNVASAWINLGRKDMLQPGTVFRLKSPNSDKIKAYASVARVEQERAEVTLYDVVDPIGDQVREGDLLFNELYSPNASRNIYLMGRFSYPYNKPELEKLLVALGNKVHQKMEPGVDLVLLGNASISEEADGLVPVTESAEYKEALNLGVEFAPLQKIRDLIKL